MLAVEEKSVNETISESSSETCSNISGCSYCKICDPKCKYFDCIFT